MISQTTKSHHDTATVRVHPVHLTNAAQRRPAAEHWTKPISLSHRSAYRQTPFIIITQLESWYSV